MLKVTRRAYTTKKGRMVKSSTFLIRDRGLPGRGPKLIPIKRSGLLGVGFFSKSVAEQHRILKGAARKYGEKSVQGDMQAKATWNKNVNPALSHKAQRLRSWVARNFDGKKYIGK